jgi:hypothetical protein
MHRNGRVSSLFSTELRFPKLDVAGSIPVSRSNCFNHLAELCPTFCYSVYSVKP